jgi:hypothetical protein
MIFDEAVHGFLQDTAQLEFIASAQFPDHIPETIGHAAYEMYGQFPAFPVFAQMLKEKIIQPILDDVLDHIMPPVFHQEEGKRSQVTVGQRLLVNPFQNLLVVRGIAGIEFIPQFLVKSIVKIIL